MITPAEQEAIGAHYRAENATDLRPSLCAGNPEDIDAHTPKTIDVTAAWQSALAKLAVAESMIARARVKLDTVKIQAWGMASPAVIVRDIDAALQILNEK